MKHLSRWHSVTAGTATAAVAAGAFGLSSILTGPGASPAPIELSASEQSGDAIGDDSADDAGPRVEVQQDQPVAPTPDASNSAGSPSPDSPSPASVDSPSPDSPSPTSVDSPSSDSPSPASVDSPDEVVSPRTASATPAVVQDSPSDAPASISAASASADSVSASTSVDSAS